MLILRSQRAILFQRLLSKLGSQAHFKAMCLSFAAKLSAGKGVKESKSKIKNSNLCCLKMKTTDLKRFMLRYILNDYGDNHHLRTRDISPENIGSFITVTRVVSNCFRSLIVTFRACKVTYEIIFLCNVYIEYSISWRPKFMIWRPKFFH